MEPLVQESYSRDSAAEDRGSDGVNRAVRLVLGVARLGELDLRGWWNCHGLDRAGNFVLGRTFPRTSRLVGLELDVLSARRRHEDALAGRSTALHLFSDGLPFRRWASAWLSAQKTASSTDPFLDELAGWDTGRAVAWLVEQAGESEPGAEAIADGLRLGQVSQSDLKDGLKLQSVERRLAAAYAGLGGDFKAPYFDLAR